MERFGENGPVVKVGNEADIGTGKNRVMKFMLRDFETGLLYRRPGEWVENHLQATGFAGPEEAQTEGRTLAKATLEVFCIWPDGKPAWGQRIQT